MAVSIAAARPVPARHTIGLTPLVRLLLLLGLVAVAMIAFMTLDARGNWDFVLPFRFRKLAALTVVACAIAMSTVSFQTITANRILTPSIMGFDALYLLIQTVAVFMLGSTTFVMIDQRIRFGIEVGAMMLLSGALFWWLFFRSQRDLYFLLLVGIIFGVFFRSITQLLMRIIDPAEFVVLQDLAFASFNAVDQTLLTVSSGIVAICGVVLWRMHGTLDAMLLGRPAAISLGVDYQRSVMAVFAVVVMLVSVSTSLVGPITFVGLLVAHLAYGLAGTWRHSYVVPMCCLVSIATLVGGQMILEHVFQYNTTLSIIVEFLGGLTFLVLVFRGRVT